MLATQAHRDAHGGGSAPTGCHGDHAPLQRVQIDGYSGGSRTGPGTMTATFTVTPADASCRALLLGRTANRASISPSTGAERTVTVTAVAVGDLKVYVYCTHPRLKRSIEPAVFTVLDPSCSEALAVTAAGVTHRGRWAAGCTSSQRGNAQTPYYARYYTFALGTESDVTVALVPDNDAPAYLDLLPPAGVGVEAQRAEGLDPRITAVDLPAGDYTIETTHRDPRTAGGFAITVTAVSAPTEVTVTGLAASYSATVNKLFGLSFDFEPKEATPSVKSIEPSGLKLGWAHHDGTMSVVGSATHADTYTVEFAFTQAGREDTHTVTVTAVCAAGHSQQRDRSCKPDPVCTQSLGSGRVGSGTLEGSDSWDSGCLLPGVRRAGGPFYAKHYEFTLALDAVVTIDVTSSDTDAFLFLLKGHGSGGGELRHDNNSGDGRNARLAGVSLPAGDYTVTATTNESERVGSFKVTVTAVAAGTTDLKSSYDAVVGQTLLVEFTVSPAGVVEPRFPPVTIPWLGVHLRRVDPAGLGLKRSLSFIPDRAHTWNLELSLIQPGRTDIHRFSVTATCATGYDTAPDGRCIPAGAGPAIPSRCIEDLVTALQPVWGRITATGTWGAGCASTQQPSSAAKYYRLYVTTPGGYAQGNLPIKIELTSDPTARMFLHAGTAPTTARLLRFGTSAERTVSSGNVYGLSFGSYIIEVATSQPYDDGSTNSFKLAVQIPSGVQQHLEVQHIGNTGRNGNGWSLPDFIARHPKVGRILGADAPYLDWQTDGCDGTQHVVSNTSALPLGRIQLLHRFESACMRHDFNWQNLSRIEKSVDPTVDSWNQRAIQDSNERLEEDLTDICRIVNELRTYANPFTDYHKALSECALQIGKIMTLLRSLPVS